MIHPDFQDITEYDYDDYTDMECFIYYIIGFIFGKNQDKINAFIHSKILKLRNLFKKKGDK